MHPAHRGHTPTAGKTFSTLAITAAHPGNNTIVVGDPYRDPGAGELLFDKS